MEVKNDKPSNTGAQQVFKKKEQDNDSVSTFQSKRAPPSEIATSQAKKAKTLDVSSSTSSTSSLSVTTKHSITTLNTRMSEIENEMKAVKARLASKVDQILQQLQINQGTIVTPTKTSNKRSAAQLENPGESTKSPGQG